MFQVGYNSYVPVGQADLYWEDRGNAEWGAALFGEVDKQVLLVKATDWIDRTFAFIGNVVFAHQRLAWPRSVGGDIPFQVEEATCIIADLYRQDIFDLEGVVTDKTAATTKTKVEGLEIEYEGKYRLRGPDIPSHVFALLRPLLSSPSLLRA